MPAFFTFINTRIWWGHASNSCPGNLQTYLHAPGSYCYRSDISEKFWAFMVWQTSCWNHRRTQGG